MSLSGAASQLERELDGTRWILAAHKAGVAKHLQVLPAVGQQAVDLITEAERDVRSGVISKRFGQRSEAGQISEHERVVAGAR